MEELEDLQTAEETEVEECNMAESTHESVEDFLHRASESRLE